MTFDHNLNQANQEKVPKPVAPFIVIPTQVFEDPELGDNEKLLYIHISKLCGRYGYCFASTKYLAKLRNCHEREVFYNLENLEKKNYIKRVTQKVGMQWDRKIYITHATVDSNNSYEAHPSSPSTCTPVQYNKNKYINNKKDLSKDRSKKGGKPPKPPLSHLKFEFLGKDKLVKVKPDELKKLREKMSEEELKHWVKEMEDYLTIHGKKGYKDYYRAILQWKRREEEKGKKYSSPKAQNPQALEKKEKEIRDWIREEIEKRQIIPQKLGVIISKVALTRNVNGKVSTLFFSEENAKQKLEALLSKWEKELDENRQNQ